MDKCWVYVIESEITKRRYVGLTSDLDRRLKEHNGGHCRSTKSGAPWKLIYKEAFSNHEGARTREKFLKSGQGREWLRSEIASGDFNPP